MTPQLFQLRKVHTAGARDGIVEGKELGWRVVSYTKAAGLV
jgi:hypothetical protein